jgi:hypothetical protein
LRAPLRLFRGSVTKSPSRWTSFCSCGGSRTSGGRARSAEDEEATSGMRNHDWKNLSRQAGSYGPDVPEGGLVYANDTALRP